MPSLEQIEQDLKHIQDRNVRVAADKAWETSWVRKCSIAILTYMVVVIFFITADLPRPFINALVPVFGYTLSTLTIGIIKSWWLKIFYKK